MPVLKLPTTVLLTPSSAIIIYNKFCEGDTKEIENPHQEKLYFAKEHVHVIFALAASATNYVTRETFYLCSRMETSQTENSIGLGWMVIITIFEKKCMFGVIMCYKCCDRRFLLCVEELPSLVIFYGKLGF